MKTYSAAQPFATNLPISLFAGFADYSATTPMGRAFGRGKALGMEQPARTKKLSAGAPMVGFRLDPQSHRVLAERAGFLGVSSHELARHYLMEALTAHEEQMELRKAVSSLGEIMFNARKDFAHAVEALLVTTGNVSKEAAAA